MIRRTEIDGYAAEVQARLPGSTTVGTHDALPVRTFPWAVSRFSRVRLNLALWRAIAASKDTVQNLQPPFPKETEHVLFGRGAFLGGSHFFSVRYAFVMRSWSLMALR